MTDEGIVAIKRERMAEDAEGVVST